MAQLGGLSTRGRDDREDKADKETDEVLGVHIVGARAADLIMERLLLWNTEPLLKTWQGFVMDIQPILRL